EIVWRPMLLGGVFKAIGTAQIPEWSMPASKGRLNALDMVRWADHLGVPLVAPEMHPARTVLALCAALSAGDDVVRASKALFRAYWEFGHDLSEPTLVRRALDYAGLDGGALVARAEEPQAKITLRARTDEAIAAGVFGAPAFVFNGELIWGQDRLALLEHRLNGKLPEPIDPAGDPGGSIAFYFDFSSPF